MRTLKITALGILYFIVTTILAVIVAFITLLAYYALQFFLFSKGSYLLFVSGGLNTIPIFMIMIMLVYLIIYIFFRIQEKYFERKEKQIIIDEEDGTVDIEKLSKLQKLLFKLLNKFIPLDDIRTNIFKIIKICYISILIISMYCGMTSYAILYSGSIKVGSPLKPTGITYKYTDITNVQVGVAGSNEKSYEPYYKVIFNDNKSVNLLGGSSMQTDKEDFEYVLVNLDKELRAQGVIKSVNKENFDKYSKGLDRDFISRMEKLFNDK